MISDQVYLIGGVIYQLELKYRHSVHELYEEQEQAYLKLFWQSDSIQKSIVNY